MLHNSCLEKVLLDKKYSKRFVSFQTCAVCEDKNMTTKGKKFKTFVCEAEKSMCFIYMYTAFYYKFLKNFHFIKIPSLELYVAYFYRASLVEFNLKVL